MVYIKATTKHWGLTDVVHKIDENCSLHMSMMINHHFLGVAKCQKPQEPEGIGGFHVGISLIVWGISDTNEKAMTIPIWSVFVGAKNLS